MKAVVDTWTDYNVTKDEFSTAIDRSLAHSRANGGIAYIVVFPAFVNAKIKYFVTAPSKSAVTNMGVKGYCARVGPLGLHLVDVDSMKSAVDWLKKNAQQGSVCSSPSSCPHEVIT